jgi:hypothetical protein
MERAFCADGGDGIDLAASIEGFAASAHRYSPAGFSAPPAATFQSTASRHLGFFTVTL